MSRNSQLCSEVRRVVVVGGGAEGLACAWRLAEAGVDLIVLDAGELGRGALWASGGMLAAGFEACVELSPGHPLAEPFIALALASADMWGDWAARLARSDGPALGYERRGSITPAFNDADSARLDQAERLARRFGVAAERVDASTLGALEPLIAPGRGGLVFPGDGQLDNRVLAQALIDGLQARGATLRSHSRVTRLDRKASRVSGVTLTSGEQIEADAVVLAVGAAAPDWAPASAGMDPVKGQMLAFSVDRAKAPDRIVRGLSIYLAAKPDGRVVAGATSEPGVTDCKVEPAVIADLAERAFEVMPSLRDAAIVERWAGLRPRAADAMPVIGQSEPGLYLAAGGYRNGVLLAPAIAEAIARDVLDGERLWPAFSPGRDGLAVNLG